MRRNIVLLLTVCAFGCAALTPSVTSWSQRDPIPIYVLPGVDEDCAQALDEAFLFWAAQGVTYLDVPLQVEAPEQARAIILEPGSPGADYVGVTWSLENEQGQRYQSVIRLRAATCNAIIAAHELGHALGLGHDPDPGNVMFHRPSGTEVRDSQRRAVQ